jgi:hypothetical protein
MSFTAGTPVVFNYATWSARYPEFATTVTAPSAQEFFNEATLYCDNTGTGPAACNPNLPMFLNMLTAHIAQLNVGSAIQPVNAVVGRISNASEGSVSVAAEYSGERKGREWYIQTKYGAAYWAATAQYRSFRVNPARPYNPDAYFRGW